MKTNHHTPKQEISRNILQGKLENVLRQIKVKIQHTKNPYGQQHLLFSFFFIDNGHDNGCEIEYHCCFDLNFPINK